MRMEIAFTLNGCAVACEVRAGEILAETLRRLGVFSVKQGCQDGNCGACVVMMNGEAVSSCLVFSGQAQGACIVTTEGLGTPVDPHPIQEELVRAGAVQCGFCTPGIVAAAKALLDRAPSPSDGEIREALDGNLCRCTGYVKIIEAVRNAAARMEVTP